MIEKALIAIMQATSLTAATPTQEIYFPPSLRKATISCGLGARAKPIPIITEQTNRWYSGQLSAAHEPSLSRRPARRDTLRFTWLRSFHAPVIVRVDGLHSMRPRLVATQRAPGSCHGRVGPVAGDASFRWHDGKG